ncbi:single-stranded DNA-binding protein [Streptomyces sp. NPDC091292]|uniref:single-stranded DNA-binding protein n=1 Tax=Streptomyces sp. NPDC091292 TaxID=3365991 RepID=UPI00382B3424
MNETLVTVVGNVATAPVYREMPTGSVARFRLAVTARHRDRTKDTWVDGHTNFFTVWAWKGLGTNAAASLSVGDPVIVQGRLKVRFEEGGAGGAGGTGGARGGGPQWASADIDAYAIGHDLSRGTSAFRRTSAVRAADPASPERQQPRPEPDFAIDPVPRPAEEPTPAHT